MVFAFVINSIWIIYHRTGSICYHQTITATSPLVMTAIWDLIHQLKNKPCLQHGVRLSPSLLTQLLRYFHTLPPFSMLFISFTRFRYYSVCFLVNLFMFESVILRDMFVNFLYVMGIIIGLKLKQRWRGC